LARQALLPAVVLPPVVILGVILSVHHAGSWIMRTLLICAWIGVMARKAMRKAANATPTKTGHIALASAGPATAFVR